MKANEFVKKYGWERAKAASKMHIADFCRCFDLPMSFLIDMRDDLERLVESYELIESYGGLEDATKVCIQLHCKGEDTSKLKQAILDVDSCNVG